MNHLADRLSPVEQILFGLTPIGGLGVTQSSAGISQRQAAVWDDRLNKYNRLSPTTENGVPWLPERAFSYFEFSDGQAAVLGRFKTDGLGRNNSHALVGSIETLAPYAMFLSDWDGWLPDNARGFLSAVDSSEWQGLREPWLAYAIERVHQDRETLTRLVESILSSPSSYLTLSDHKEPLPFLTITREILDPVLSTPGGGFGWGFSTYGHSDTRPEASPAHDGAPLFWCVVCLPESGETERQRVGGHDRLSDGAFAELAAELVDGYLRNPREYRSAIEDRLGTHGTRGQRVQKLMAVSEGSRAPHSWSADPVDRSVAGAETELMDFSGVKLSSQHHGAQQSGDLYVVHGSGAGRNTGEPGELGVKGKHARGSRGHDPGQVSRAFDKLSKAALAPGEKHAVADLRAQWHILETNSVNSQDLTDIAHSLKHQRIYLCASLVLNLIVVLLVLL